MLRFSRRALGYEKWPWPARLPFRDNWWGKAPVKGSVSGDVRGLQIAGDAAVVLVLLYAAFRAYHLSENGEYQTRLQHLNRHPPAILAQEFDFAHPEKNRKLSSAALDEYRAEASAAKRAGRPVEEVIFKY